MRRRHPLPKLWFLTDERQGEGLWGALKSLPKGSGVIVRHYDIDTELRHHLFERIRGIARARRLVLVLAGSAQQARIWHADGIYGMSAASGRLTIAPVHGLSEIRQAERNGADLLLLSPVFATRSHPGACPLGIVGFARLVRTTRLPVIALGGVGARHEVLLKKIGAYGWAGIDAFIGARGSRLRT